MSSNENPNIVRPLNPSAGEKGKWETLFFYLGLAIMGLGVIVGIYGNAMLSLALHDEGLHWSAPCMYVFYFGVFLFLIYVVMGSIPSKNLSDKN